MLTTVGLVGILVKHTKLYSQNPFWYKNRRIHKCTYYADSFVQYIPNAFPFQVTAPKAFLFFTTAGNMMKVLRGHQNWVYCSAFSPDSSVLCSVGAGKAVRTSDSILTSWLDVLCVCFEYYCLIEWQINEILKWICTKCLVSWSALTAMSVILHLMLFVLFVCFCCVTDIVHIEHAKSWNAMVLCPLKKKIYITIKVKEKHFIYKRIILFLFK